MDCIYFRDRHRSGTTGEAVALGTTSTMYTASSFIRPGASRQKGQVRSASGGEPSTESNKPLSVIQTGLDHPPPSPDPRTPEGRERDDGGRPGWFDSGGSRVPLVSKQPGLHDVEEASDTSSYAPPNKPVATRPSPLARASTSHNIVPGSVSGDEVRLPRSVHADYVSSRLQPKGRSYRTQTPPPIVRSSSAPPNKGISRELFASSDDETDGAIPGKSIPVYKAKILESGKQIEDSLRTHLDKVLRVQKEIGRLHRDLEGISSQADVSEVETEDGKVQQVDANQRRREALKRREDGLDGIMDQLAVLSNVLRAYHAHGTPHLSFPQPSTKNTTGSVDNLPTPPDGSSTGAVLLPAAVPIHDFNNPTTSTTRPLDVTALAGATTAVNPDEQPPAPLRSATTDETSGSPLMTPSPKAAQKPTRKSTWGSLLSPAAFGLGSNTASVQSPTEMDKADRRRPW